MTCHLLLQRLGVTAPTQLTHCIVWCASPQEAVAPDALQTQPDYACNRLVSRQDAHLLCMDTPQGVTWYKTFVVKAQQQLQRVPTDTASHPCACAVQHRGKTVLYLIAVLRQSTLAQHIN
jgi:hypothetical protein